MSDHGLLEPVAAACATGACVGWDDPRIIVLSIGVLASLGMSAYTLFSNRKIRRNDQRLQMFNRDIRNRIEAELDKQSEIVEGIHTAMLQFREIKRQKMLIDIQKKLRPRLMRELQRAVVRADDTEYVTGTDWASLVDTYDENLSSAFDMTNNPASDEQLFRDGVDEINRSIVKIQNGLRSKLDAEEERLRG